MFKNLLCKAALVVSACFMLNSNVCFAAEENETSMPETTAEEVNEIVIDPTVLTANEREAIRNTASSMIEQINYKWGGNAKKDKNGITQNGLDCSGFVGYIYSDVLDIDITEVSTSTIESYGFKKISVAELQIGDVALFYDPGHSTNHIGIFAGYDVNGVQMWINNSQSKGTVIVTHSNTKYTVFYAFKKKITVA